jgi:MFS transporter, YNFM family, putative membrane transport protein
MRRALSSDRAGIVGFLLGVAGMFAAMYSTQAILPELARDFGVSASRAGLSVSVVVLAVAVGAWVWGPISDRIGRPRAIRTAAWLLVLPSLGVALAPTFALLLACRVLQGLCMPGLLVAGAPYVVEAFVPRVGARVMGWYVSALVLGGLVGRVGVALATGLVGWRPAVGALALAPLAAALVMRGRLPDVAPPRRSGRALGALLNPALLAVAATGGALFFTFVGTFTYVTFRLEEPPFSLAPTTASLVFGLWIVGALGPAVGRLAQRVGWRRLTAAALGLATVGVLLTAIESLVPVVAGLACIAVAMFGGYTATQLGVGDVARTDRGAASALYFSAYYGSGALGAYVPGLAWETWGWNGVAALGLASLGLAAAGLTAVRRATK